MLEYRVLWKREGQSAKRAIFQTREGAVRGAERQASAADDMDWLPETLAELVAPPVIEERDVSAWRPSEATESIRG